MSRTRIVKGNITKITGGSYKIYSKESIENAGSKVIQVGKEKGVSYGSPETPPEQYPNNNKCPRCEILTAAELKQVFPAAKDENILNDIVTAFNTYCKKFNVNRCLFKAHFFAQAKQESGDNLVPALNGESMDYGIPGLKNTGFKNVSKHYMFGKLNGIEMAEQVGRKDTYKDKDGKLNHIGGGIVKRAPHLSLQEQIKVANFVYGLNPKAKDLGNIAPKGNESLSEDDNEGWAFRGRGMLQITGRATYTEVETKVNKRLEQSVLSISTPRKGDAKFTPEEALLTGFADWYFHGMYAPASLGCTEQACRSVIHIINGSTKSKTKRIANLIGGKWYQDDNLEYPKDPIPNADCMKTIFKIDECLNLKKK